MIAGAGDAWFSTRTSGAPEALRCRVEKFFMGSSAPDLGSRLSQAGGAALTEATRADAGRAAALDLLAADALITLALLLAAEQDPGRLGTTAAGLRRQATSTP